MSAVQYPFIDIAIHERVREQFAAGKALVLFSPDMKDVLWANGRGARLFRSATIYDLMERGAPGGDITLRQARAAAGALRKSGDSASFTIRVTAGFERVSARAQVERIDLPDSQSGILLSVPDSPEAQAGSDSASPMLEGFDDPNTHMAVMSENGSLIAASPDFDRLELYAAARFVMIQTLERSSERIIKRLLATALGNLPCALARVTDNPASYLLFIVQPQTEEQAEAPQEPASGSVPQHDDGASQEPAQAEAEAEIETVTHSGSPVQESAFDQALAAIADIDELEEQVEEDPDFTEVGNTLPAALGENDHSASPQALREEAPRPASVSRREPENDELVPADEMPAAASSGETSPFGRRRDTRATRFVWKIDADGNFSEISPELMNAVGPHAAEVTGLSFGDVAALFNLDPEGRITELLNRRDTWSGKTIWWPIEGTSLVVPIDIAALPTYSRSREFDGFRGFGIIRMADAKEDPLALGLTLVSGDQEDEPVLDELDDASFVTFTDRASELRQEDAAAPASEAELPEPAVAQQAEVAEEAEASIETGQPLETEAETPDQAPAEELEPISPEEVDAFYAELEGMDIEDAADLDAAADYHAENADEVEQTPQEPDSEEAGDDAGAEPAPAAAMEEIAALPDEEKADRPIDNSAVDVQEERSPEANEQPERMPLPPIEKPVLRIVENPGQRYTDKIVRFDEHRLRTGDRLTPGEQAAFQEIARRLEAFRRGEEASKPQKAAEIEPAAETPDVARESASQNTARPGSLLHAGLDAEDDALPTAPAVHEVQQEPVVEEVEERDGASIETEEAVDAEDVVQAEDGPHSLEKEGTDPLEQNGEPNVGADDEPDAEVAPEADIEQEREAAPQAEDEEAPITLAQAYAEAANLRPRPQLSAEIIDQMPVALLVHSGDDLIHANAEFLRLTGYESLEQLADVGGLDALLQRHELDDKTSEAGGMVVVRADDVIVPVTARLQSVRYEEGSALILALMPNTAGTEAAKPDLSPKAIAEHQAQADEVTRLTVEVDELRAILDTATDGVVTLGADGDIRSMNRAASALFNYDNAETIGKPFVMLFAHESQKSVLDYLSGLTGFGVASLLNDGREVIGRESSGGFVPLFMTIGKLSSSNGFCAVIRDITQWKRTEEELRNAKRAAETASAHKTEFLAHVSHEIRTPLNAIIGFADMMATERLGPIGHSRYVEYANDIGRSGRHVLDIVNDLLDISKIEAGEMDLDFASVGLNETIAEAVSLLQPQANTQRVIIRTALSQAVPPVVADLRSIKQIVLNILSNAIRFTPSGGQIVVSTSYEANGSVVLRVRDTGIGMTRSELELAMKPFRQVAGASRKRGDGTGLGLPLTKAMVDANRAVFSIHSAPNEGTLVEVTFPSPRVLAD
ncbi:ATP-binding protein [Rhizobium helianthi]|uniref:histidine kinase n=1 Tax=Rhizobium helianthi TaxID=1132695 RepID=A0ABW4M3S6_9HYPH